MGRNPTLKECEDETHTPQMGLGSPLGLPKLQSLIVEVKTPRIKVFFISLKSYWSVDVENGFTSAIWTSTTHVMAKKKGRESNWQFDSWPLKVDNWPDPSACKVECETPLESFWGKLQVCFKLHPNRRFEQRVMTSQSLESPNWDSFETLTWESHDKKPFRCRCCEKT